MIKQLLGAVTRGLEQTKVGTSEALLAKWLGPWKIVKFSPPALLVTQTTWLGMRGRKEVCREIVINKLKPFKQALKNVQECQMEEEEIPSKDLNKEAIEPRVEVKDSQA